MGKVDEMSYSKEAQLKFQTRGSQAQAQILPLKTQAPQPIHYLTQSFEN